MGRNEFPTTSWSLVVAAGNPVDPDSRDALLRLCECYWYPVYAYVRRRGYPEQDAQDLTQDFFVRILEGRYLDRVDPDRGRFRSFLLNSCKFFLADQADYARAQKRGAGAILPFEVGSGEQQYRFEPLDNQTPEHIFERGWAIVLIDRVVSCLRDEFVQHGDLDDFEKLKTFLLGQAEIPYIELARDMGTTEGRLKSRDPPTSQTLPNTLPKRDRGNRGRPGGGRFRNSLSDERAAAKRLTRGMHGARGHLSISECRRVARCPKFVFVLPP